MSNGSWLVMSQGPQPGQSFMLDKDWITVGRDPSNDIEISDPQVSRQHARITRQGKTTIIEDLGSTNGTYVNGVRLTGSHVMANGDVIGLGDAVTLTFYEEGLASDVSETVVGRPASAEAAPPVSYELPTQPPSSAEPAEEEAAPPPPPPQAAPAPPPAYPAEPAPPEPSSGGKSNTAWLLIGCGVLLLMALLCGALFMFLWNAPASFWEPFRPLLEPLQPLLPF